MKRGVIMWNETKNRENAMNVKIGDKCHVEGNPGTVTGVSRPDNEHTYIRVQFDESTGLTNTAYNNAWYGSFNWAFTYLE